MGPTVCIFPNFPTIILYSNFWKASEDALSSTCVTSPCPLDKIFSRWCMSCQFQLSTSVYLFKNQPPAFHLYPNGNFKSGYATDLHRPNLPVSDMFAVFCVLAAGFSLVSIHLRFCAMKQGSPSPTKDTVKRRWDLLQDALCAKRKRSSSRTSLMEEPQKYFHLVTVTHLTELLGADFAWFRYDVLVNGLVKTAKIRHPLRSFNVEDLIGFNNTGNVRVWPSEEILTFVVLRNEAFFNGKSVLEVGGGMSCLAGVLLARYVSCERVHLTDGNKAAIDNVRYILGANEFMCPIFCEVLRWQEYEKHPSSYDVIMAADCLFFDEYHEQLLRLLAALLKPDGVILIVAPRRAGTLQKFADLSGNFGLRHSVREHYDEIVSSQRCRAVEEGDNFDEDLDYPLLLVMDKVADPLAPMQWPDRSARADAAAGPSCQTYPYWSGSGVS